MILFILLAKGIAITIFFASIGYSTPLCIETEKQALLSFKQGLKDPLEKLKSWDAARDEDCCRWDGIFCDNVTGHVSELSLNNGAVTGKINPSLLNLTHLTRLDLGSDHFGIIIPNHLANLSSLQNYLKAKNLDWLSGLTSLEYLNMNYVNLSEASDHWLLAVNKVPSLVELHLSMCQLRHIFFPPHVNLTSLQVIDLSGNSLQGELPWAIGNLTSLVSLNLRSNDFSVGNMPKSVENLCSLEIFDLSSNMLSGKLSKFFESLSGGCLSKKLKSLDLDAMSWNGTSSYVFSGEITNIIGVFESLEYLSLTGNNINGSLPVSIGKLKALKFLDVSRNSLGGTIPESLGSLSNLETLRLSDNKLSGTISESLGSLSSLEMLELNSNQLTGPLPKSIGALIKLKNIDVTDNQLNGSLPDSFGSLSNLETIFLWSNKLEGKVSEIHFANPSKLTGLYASDNKLTLKVSPDWTPPFSLDVLQIGSWRLGPQFPMWLKTQAKLTYLDLSNTGISDAVPAWFWKFSTRRPIINLSQNQIYGQIPYLHGFRDIDLNSNKFNGSLPRISSVIGALDLSNNSLSGDMSHFLCHPRSGSGKLRELYLRHNLLSGKVPDCWNHWSKMPLRVIDLSNNDLSGEIPSSMGHLHGLWLLHLRNNRFTGELPTFLRNYLELKGLDLGLNNFVGKMPSWLGNLQQLEFLSLRSNKLEGNIPVYLCALASLHILDIAHNKLFGVIPKCFKNLTAMTTQIQFGTTGFLELVTKGMEMQYGYYIVTMLDVSSNSFSGEIPEEITSLKELKSLNLSRNNFRGAIPLEIGKLTQLESLDLSRNQLSGSIPQSMSSLTFLAYTDLSHNNLSGRIPTGTQLQGFNASMFVGNRLCGPPLTKDCGEGDRITDRGVVTDDGASEDEEDYWFRLGIAVGFGVGFLGIILPLFCSRIWRMAYFWFFQEYLWYKIVDSLNDIFKT